MGYIRVNKNPGRYNTLSRYTALQASVNRNNQLQRRMRMKLRRGIERKHHDMVFDIELFGSAAAVLISLFLYSRTFLIITNNPPNINPPNIHIPPKPVHAQFKALTHGRFPNTTRSFTAAIPTGRENRSPHLEQGVIPLAKAIICMTLHHQKKHPEQPKSRHQKVTAKVLYKLRPS